MFDQKIKETMSKISLGRKTRESEEMTRPRVEMKQDDWVDWISGHERKKKKSEGLQICNIPWLRSSPLCGQGHH